MGNNCEVRHRQRGRRARSLPIPSQLISFLGIPLGLEGYREVKKTFSFWSSIMDLHDMTRTIVTSPSLPSGERITCNARRNRVLENAFSRPFIINVNIMVRTSRTNYYVLMVLNDVVHSTFDLFLFIILDKTKVALGRSTRIILFQ